jgi:hypothetical protein
MFGDVSSMVCGEQVGIFFSSALTTLGAHKRALFAQSLLRAERVLMTSRSPSSLPRGALLEALACADIHLTRLDAQDIWDEMATALRQQLKGVEVLQWLEVEIPVAEPTEPGLTTPLSGDSQPRRSTTLGSYRDLNHNAVLRDSSDANRTSPRLQTIRSLLRNKAHLAFVFRSYGCGSGIVSGADLCHALRQVPFEITLDDTSLWAFVCQMVSIPPTSPPSSVFLRYNEVIDYLESELGSLSPSVSTTLQASLRQKLEASRYIQGNPERVVGHLQILRQRLKNIQQRGSATSWEGVPDMCSIREFLSLLQTIDLTLSVEEAELIWEASRKNRSEESSWNFLTGSADDGVKAISIGAGLMYLRSLLTTSLSFV